MTADEFVDQVVYPATNACDDVAHVEELMTTGAGVRTDLRVVMNDGSAFVIRVELADPSTSSEDKQ